jgi:hypothetical protein
MSGLFADLAEQVIGWVIQTTAAMIGVVIGWILDSPDGALTSGAVGSMIDQGITVGRYLVPLMLLLGVMQVGGSNRPGHLLKLVFVEMPLVVAAMAVVAPVAGLLLAATDAITSWVIDESAVTAMQSAFNNLPGAVFLRSTPQFMPVVAVLSLAALIGALVVWGMMLMRNLGVALSVVLGPGMLAARLWPAAAGWASRWASLLVALIVVKPVIGFMLSLSWIMLGAGVDPAQGFLDVQALAMGLLAFLGASLVPSFMFKFVPQIGDAVAGRLSSGLAQVTLTGVGVATSAVFAVRGFRAPSGSGGATGVAAGPVPISPAGRPGGDGG